MKCTLSIDDYSRKQWTAQLCLAVQFCLVSRRGSRQHAF